MAVKAKMANTNLPLQDALEAGGFVFVKDPNSNGMIDLDGTSLVQRKNNLCRRVRLEKEEQMTPPSGHGAIRIHDGRQQQQQQQQRTRFRDALDQLPGIVVCHHRRRIGPADAAADADADGDEWYRFPAWANLDP